MNLEVQKEDLRHIGKGWFNNDGTASVYINTQTMGIDEIFLKNILKCFGNEYKIVKKEFITDTNEYGENCYAWIYHTNLPENILEEALGRN